MPRATALAVIATIALMIFSSGVSAIPLAMARQYQPLPVETNVFFAGYSHLSANTEPDLSIPVAKSANVDVNGGAAVYLHYLDVGGNTGYLWASLTGAGVDASIDTTFFGQVARSTSGVGQPVLGFNYGYKGAPAMAPQQFMCWQQTTTMNAAFYVSPPLGTYDRNRLLNTSTNRWEFKPEFTWAHRSGHWLAEIYANAQFFSDNTEFLGNNTLSQNPVYGLDGHFSYDFNPKNWASFDVYQSWGGRISVNDKAVTSLSDFTALGFTASHAVSPTDLAFLIFSKTVSGSGGRPEFTSVQLLYGHLW